MIEVLPIVWAGILVLELALYVLLDGADLGIGVLSVFAKSEEQRSTMIKSIGPVWDANETWLVIAGGTLFGAFPLAYAVVLNALQIPVMLLVFGLIFRAASFEFREHAQNKRLWSWVFSIGSFLAIVSQGFILGGLLGGIKIQNGDFAGGPLDWLTPLSLLLGVGVVAGYTMLGYSFLIKKTRGNLEMQSYHQLLFSAFISLFVSAAIVIVLPLASPFVLLVWSNPLSQKILIGLLFCVFISFCMLIQSVLQKRNDYEPYFWSIAIFLFGFAALLFASYPYIIPPSVTIFEAASSKSTQQFMLFGMGILVPVVLFYNIYVHSLFEGKVDDEDDDGYAK